MSNADGALQWYVLDGRQHLALSSPVQTYAASTNAVVSRACGRLCHPPSTSSLSGGTQRVVARASWTTRVDGSVGGQSAARLDPAVTAPATRTWGARLSTAQFARSVALLYRESIAWRLRRRRGRVKTLADAVVVTLARMTDFLPSSSSALMP